jgi:hypothetical protein
MDRSEIKKAGISGYLLVFVLIMMIPSLFAPDRASASEEQTSEYEDSEPDIRRGERFFKGLLPFDRKHKACTECHNIKYSDTLNWNPSAYEIALKYSSLEFSAFRAVVTEPGGVKMAASHENIAISDNDLIHVKAYLDDMAKKGALPQKPTFFNLMLFIFLGLVVIWALIELLFLHHIGYKFIPVILFLGAFGWQAKMVVTEAITLGRQQHYAPDQPVKFSHKVHAGDQGIDCMYCHTTAEHSKSAGIPPASLCMNCHVLIREGTNSGRFEIAKVVDAFETETELNGSEYTTCPTMSFSAMLSM